MKQIQLAFPDHWRRIWECMDPWQRGHYLACDAEPLGAMHTLVGAFDWQRTDEGYAYWFNVARQAQVVPA